MAVSSDTRAQIEMQINHSQNVQDHLIYIRWRNENKIIHLLYILNTYFFLFLSLNFSIE